jgi:hypothetical protein
MVLTGDGTCHDAEGQLMTSGGQLMTEKDPSSPYRAAPRQAIDSITEGMLLIIYFCKFFKKMELISEW